MPGHLTPTDDVLAAVKESLKLVDGRLFWSTRGRGRTLTKEAGTVRPDGYRQVNIAGSFLLTHRVVWFLYYDEWPSQEIDHIDGNKSNNDPANLRLASREQQLQNTRKTTRGIPSSIYKGVSWCNSAKSWAVRICHNKRTLRLGYFKDEELASLVYDEWATRLFRQFAKLNN
jgi:hypothetical protein